MQVRKKYITFISNNQHLIKKTERRHYPDFTQRFSKKKSEGKLTHMQRKRYFFILMNLLM
ncbi:MAG: hypothetical protein D3923_12280 [Candidatus Electrothrix sp. AR3]|nr:hypothetical protein [Candidatus Electrothrix sp. AR3]